MPHKHTRRKGNDDVNFDLAPSVLAKPLAVTQKNASKPGKKSRKQDAIAPFKTAQPTKGYAHNDTPRAFARMLSSLQNGKRPRSALDDGNDDNRPSKKNKKARTSQPAAQTDVKAEEAKVEDQPLEVPKILPGERLGDFAVRVDRALPISHLARKGVPKIEGMPKERQTRKEKKMHKLYDTWREEERRIREKEEERRELEEELEEERNAEFGGAKSIEFPVSKRGAKRRRKMVGEVDEDDGDPWRQLEERRGRVQRGLHDVVEAPPALKVVPKEKFKVKGGARVEVSDVPRAAGSLKKREELGNARREVIEKYRAMMGKGSRL